MPDTIENELTALGNKPNSKTADDKPVHVAHYMLENPTDTMIRIHDGINNHKLIEVPKRSKVGPVKLGDGAVKQIKDAAEVDGEDKFLKVTEHSGSDDKQPPTPGGPASVADDSSDARNRRRGASSSTT